MRITINSICRIWPPIAPTTIVRHAVRVYTKEEEAELTDWQAIFSVLPRVKVEGGIMVRELANLYMKAMHAAHLKYLNGVRNINSVARISRPNKLSSKLRA